MYRYHQTNDEHISLHDCRAESASFENGVLAFDFREGFWIGPGHPENQGERPVGTDSSRVEFRLESGDETDAVVYVYTEKGNDTALREEWPLSRLLECINSEGCSLEFLYQYKGYQSLLIECWLWFDKKPYHKECELRLQVSGVEYFWNQLLEDRVW